MGLAFAGAVLFEVTPIAVFERQIGRRQLDAPSGIYPALQVYSHHAPVPLLSISATVY